MANAGRTQGQRLDERKSRLAKGSRSVPTQATELAESFWRPTHLEFAQRTFGNHALAGLSNRETDPTGNRHRFVAREAGDSTTLSPSLDRKAPPATLGAGSSPARVAGRAPGATLNRSFDTSPLLATDDIFFRSDANDPQRQAGEQKPTHKLTNVARQGSANQGIQGAIQRSVETGVIQRELMSIGAFRKSTSLPFGYKRSKPTKLALREVRRVLERYHEYEGEHAGEPPYERVVFTKQTLLKSLAHAIVDYKTAARHDKEAPFTRDQMELLNTQLFAEMVALDRVQTVPDPVIQNRPQQQQVPMSVPSVDTMQFGARLTDEDRQRLGLGANQGNGPGMPQPNQQQGGNGQGMPQPNQQQGQFFLDPDEAEFLLSLGQRGGTYGGMKKRKKR